MVNKQPIQVGTDLYKGMKMFRRPKCCYLEIDADHIVVKYFEYLESPTGDRVEEKIKSYIVKDEPAVMSLVDPTEESVVLRPANLNYDKWANYIITAPLVGVSLGNDIIIGTILQTLASLPFDVADGYLTQP